MKSPIRWAGSKRLLLPELSRYWNDTFARYVEPFCGSACLFFSLDGPPALLSDLNRELIDTFRWLKRDVDLVLECIRRLPVGKSAYYRIRAENPERMSEPARAARFLYLNRYCFNGIFRTNKAGSFNVPYGPPKSGGVDENVIRNAAECLRSAKLIACDFETVIDQVEPNDFVYLDPPYVTTQERVFSEYMPGSFSLNDLRRFELALHRLDRKGTRFVVSYGDFPEAREILRRWNIRRVWVRRHIAGFAGARRGANELLATNIPD
ncbi:hypothetical protein DB347_07420 [Opitutaceae bacterium EW11]|nr:hypothetical protein DB347_07420 [Opitutaceae bacterium EW11]